MPAIPAIPSYSQLSPAIPSYPQLCQLSPAIPSYASYASYPQLSPAMPASKKKGQDHKLRIYRGRDEGSCKADSIAFENSIVEWFIGRVALFVSGKAAPSRTVIRPGSDSVALTFQGVSHNIEVISMGKKFTKKTQGVLVETPWVKRESVHGSQRENAVIAGFLACGGWNRHTTPQVYAYLLPKVDWVGDGNGCGRGTAFLDAFRVKGEIAQAVSLKCPKDTTDTRSVDLFRGTKETMMAGIAAMRSHARFSKRIPLAVIRSGGATFDPSLTEWSIVDLCQLVANPGTVRDWPDEWQGVPVRPNGYKHPGRGGHPCDVWIAECPPDKHGNVYWRLTASTRKFSWTSGTAADLASQIDEACRK